jgi:hypothetical protein
MVFVQILYSIISNLIFYFFQFIYFRIDKIQINSANKIKIQSEQQLGGRDSNGKPLGQIEGDGMDSIEKPSVAPSFS